MNLQEKISKAKADAAAAKAKITDEDREWIAQRAELAKAEAERDAAEAEKRAMDLQQRFDAMRDRLGEDALIAPVEIQGRKDTFIIQCDPKAHSRWEKDIADSHSNKKLDKAEVNRNYAVALVVDWNGEQDFGPSSLNGYELIQHLMKNPGMVSPLVNAGAKLAGFFAEERKS